MNSDSVKIPFGRCSLCKIPTRTHLSLKDVVRADSNNGCLECAQLTCRRDQAIPLFCASTYSLIKTPKTAVVPPKHTQDSKGNCNTPLKIGLACSTCQNFKLCTRCYGRTGHQHDMKKVILMLSTDLFPKNNRMSGCASQVPQHPVNCFVQNLSNTYQKHRSNARGVCQFIFDHFLETNLLCNCVFCKKMFLMYKFHCIKCQVPLCSLENCTIINDQIFKRPFPTMSDDFVLQKLMKIRLIMKRAQNMSSRAAPNETTHPIARNPALLRKFTIQRCIRTLVHACQCVEANCMPASCQKMKRILGHIKVCKRKVAGGCIICKQMCTLCCYHAKSCHESRCSVLLCSYIKRKLRESKIKKRCPV